MCAINGFNFRDEALIKKMMAATSHRGPDDSGFWLGDNISLGHNRLSIIDLSENARQPLWNEDKTLCIIFNGEIYNFQELGKQLQENGHRFFSSSDTEVILHLYEDKREKCLDDLNGIFSFAIYDANKKELFLARDRAGVKPLYYYHDAGKFIFSSEIKGILSHPVPREVSKEAFAHYSKIFFTPAPFTLFKGIIKLPPAHYLIFRNGKIDIQKYWDLHDLPELNSVGEIEDSIKSLFKDSVRRQLISDRPLGIFLSGGVDSTAVLGIASELVKEKIKTYSVGFDIEVQQKKYNQDFRLARQTSGYYNTDHHEVMIKGSDARDNLEKVIWHMEEPVPNPIQIATFLLAKMAKKDVAVVLGGDGGDEIFGGYPRYYYSRLIDKYQLLPGFLRKEILPHLLEFVFKKENLKEKLNTAPGVSRYLLHMGEKSKTRNNDFTAEFLKNRYPENKFRDKIKYLMYLDLMTWLPDESLIRSDKMTMAFGLEERVPILDHRLIELAFRIPTKYKIRGRKSWKWIFKEAMKEYLPSYIFNKEKTGWWAPASKWLRGDLKDLAYEVISPSYCPETGEYFDFKELRQALDDHISGKKYNLDAIWSAVTFQIWHKLFI